MAKWKTHPRGAAIGTLIGADTVITGDVSFTGGLYLDGRIDGKVKGADAEARLDIGETGRVVGEVWVTTAIVNGAIEGELHATGRLVLGPGARVDGNVYYHVLEMAAGAEVNGKFVHRPPGEPLALEHRREEQAPDGD
ncbi:MAG: bactofilin family protein [Gammaproteobacteria bacterium]